MDLKWTARLLQTASWTYLSRPIRGRPLALARLNRPSSGVAFCLLLWAALLGLFRLNTFNEYEKRPIGDSAHFAEMTQAFYLGEPPAMQFPAMHSRRVLGPWLAGKFCALTDWIEGRKPALPFHYGYHGQDDSGHRPVEAAPPTYHRIMTAWKVLNAVAFLGIFLGLFGILQVSQLKAGTAPWQPVWLALILCCSPTLGRLYFTWPLMNDLAGISLGLLSLLCLLKRRVVLSGLLFGAGLLARENLALIYPCFLWILFASEPAGALGTARPTGRSRKAWFLAHLLLSFTPYLLICAFPVFSNIGPLGDWSSGIHQTTPGAAHDYWALILYHLQRPFVADRPVLRQAVVYWQVFGPLLFLALRYYPWKRAQLKQDRLLWAGFLLGIAGSFYVDRYVVYGVLPLVLLARHSLGSRLTPFLAACLSCFYLETLLFFTGSRNGEDLQVEFVYEARLRWIALWGACALVLVVVEPALRARFGSRSRKTALNQKIQSVLENVEKEPQSNPAN